MTLVGNVNTFNLKNHQVLILKRPSRNDWQTIYSRVGQKGPPPGLIGLTAEHALLRFSFWYFSSNLPFLGILPAPTKFPKNRENAPINCLASSYWSDVVGLGRGVLSRISCIALTISTDASLVLKI